MAEFQLGNIPGLDPLDQTSLYDQLNLAYTFQSLSVKTRIEQYYPSFGDNKSYTRLSQYDVQYKTKNFSLDVGHFYTTLGRGLLLRTYEIPGAIWETRGYRVRYGFYRDLDGVQMVYRFWKFELKVLRGRVLDVTLPPTIENETERYPDLVEGGELTCRLAKNNVGIIYMRNTNASVSKSYTSLLYDRNFGKSLSFYGELATKLNHTGNLVSFTDTSGFAAYASLNYTYQRIGISLEFKDYRNMSLGAGISDPPSLVKEHTYKLLNRVTHVPVLTDESGYQIEIFYRFQNNGMITLNNAIAKNKISATNSPVYKEYFAEYQFPVDKKFYGSVFADYAQDPLTNEDHRYTAGFTVNADHQRLSSGFEAEIQYTERVINKTIPFFNTYLDYTISHGSKYSISGILEITNDPIYVEVNKHQNYYPGIEVAYQPDNHNRISVFAGKRRGGPACNSGVCYDVLDFEGLEIRVTTRF